MPDTLPGLTTANVARMFRVGQSKVLGWIRSGELKALNTAAALGGRPRFVVTADALAAFERRRAAGPPPKPARRKKRTQLVDYYPD